MDMDLFDFTVPLYLRNAAGGELLRGGTNPLW